MEVKRENIIGKSDKNISDIKGTFLFNESVKRDVTGKWKLARIDADIKIQEYALDYYKQKFRSDDEIHGVVNFNLNKTTCIASYYDHLDIRVHEYVEKEEDDAKKLFSGKVVSEYWIYKNNGDIEQIR